MTTSNETFDNLVNRLRKAPKSKTGKSKRYPINLRDDVVAYLCEFPEAMNDLAKQAGIAKASIKYWMDAVKPTEEEVNNLLSKIGIKYHSTSDTVGSIQAQIEDLQRTADMIQELEARGYVVLKK